MFGNQLKERPLTTFEYRFFYVREFSQGKRKMLEGFVRWCKKSDVGLSQQVSVTDVIDEEPTGLYDDFYVKVQ